MNKLCYEKYITFFAVWENRGLAPVVMVRWCGALLLLRVCICVG